LAVELPIADPGARGNGPVVALAANDAWNIVNYRSGLVRALRQAGLRVAVLAPAGPQAEAVEAMGADFYAVPVSPRGTSPAEDLRTLVAFRRRLKAIGPAVFLGFTAKPNIYGSLAARSLGIPVINNISGLGSTFTRATILTRIVTGLYRLALRRSATVFLQNPDDRRLFEESRIVGRGQTALLPGSGIDLQHFAPAASLREDRPFTFLLAARLLWDKGVGEFAKAAAHIRSSGKNARFAVLGIVEPESRAAVPVAQLEAWQREGAVEFLGSSDDVRSTIAAADCVVLPSYYREGVPRVLLEAAAMAVPVITTDSPGCREAVDDSVTGLLCQPRSVDSLVAAMERMLETPLDERQRMGRAGRSKMEREFAEEIVHRQYLTALARLGIQGASG
jgi:glycosyltransferase involved in cell wall biosynthesis